MKNISILGSTGSIGTSALCVVRRHPDRFRVVGLAAGRKNLELLARQVAEFSPLVCSVADGARAAELRARLPKGCPCRVLSGPDGSVAVAVLPEAEMVVSAIVGAAGLAPTYAAIEAGKRIALANKETLVMAGEIIMREVERRGVELLPVDSEHSAIFQSLEGHQRQDVHRIILTASGGPFLNRPKEELSGVTPEEALNHPRWKMGPKVTIDSSTLMNKGLECIEARWLFAIPMDKIQVCIHPQSIIHSMVEYIDGSIIAQLGVPDMQLPIAYALSRPDRLELDVPRLDLFEVGKFTFLRPDLDKFGCLRLAFQAAAAGGALPAVLNAANEVAVNAFLSRRMGYGQIQELVASVMHECDLAAPGSIEDVHAADFWARRRAEELVCQPRGGSFRGSSCCF
ncbi:MAG: 1-deoxy-D-xylulose-5-phosphate reductoisomerase [Pseudomonadota bacterium]